MHETITSFKRFVLKVMYIHCGADDHKEILGSLELELQVVGGHLMRMLQSNSGPWQREIRLLNP